MSDKEAERMTAGEFLKQARQKANKTQKQIAEVLGLSACTVSQWELNYRNVPWEKIHEVACAYGLNETEEAELIKLRVSREEAELIKLRVSRRNEVEQTPSEFRVFYGLITLPKKARERVVRAMRAYETALEEE
ncbi:MAG: hypothetical protein A3G45_03235 [Candidatus Staskawiczbacteria bacterium RIFCSPLOWO2_12_FULL_37_15]|uniref:HTH cro/C1-type domain-containing protein n=1 Tax=Candidatus Staskawiczbacteria bacterium RIFCSPLOWO2_12_FULL_37_15 TaxID=1802218 RepID=A0A1G2ISY2_9BACT|nr:MAG: hypothetical protein US35_C0005G0011 [Parcubacteria group bacterium GW2011_GWA2_37_10]OGZ77521.1 MAG: hypothetical protein A3G45_03235 [Candidatus Staskawiczbacteria bacterium RIFCSPLOWO2_12_FULL_37_15]